VSLIDWLNEQRMVPAISRAIDAYQSLPDGATPLDSYPIDLFDEPAIRDSVREALATNAEGIARALEGTPALAWAGEPFRPRSGTATSPRA
jgi:hypothetical protein